MDLAQSLSYWSGKVYGQEDVSKIALIIVYEIADLLKALTRMEDYPDNRERYLAYAQNAIQDILAMTQLTCSLLRLDFGDAHFKGCQRAITRCQDKLREMSPED